MFGLIRHVRLKLRIYSGAGKLKRCPTDETIDDYLLNRLSKKKERKVDLHLFECAHCFKRVLEKKDLIDGVKIVYKQKSDFLEKAMKRTAKRI